MSPPVKARERPILFQGAMVRAILDGSKTQTRRVVKPQPRWNGCRWVWDKSGAVTASREWWEYMDSLSYCPYGKPGDLLYVRETWAAHRVWDDSPPSDIEAPLGVWFKEAPPKPFTFGRWRPSIHMPKKFARLWLGVTEVRVERVQDISHVGALAEGVGREPCGTCDEQGCEDCAHEGWVSERDGFAHLWDSINAKRGYSWDSNPWVWAVSFRRVDHQGGA